MKKSPVIFAINNLNSVFETWQGFDQKIKLQKINQILPLIHLTSYLNGLLEIADNINFATQKQQLVSNLESFAKDYKAIFGVVVDEAQISDFPKEVMENLLSIQLEELEMNSEIRKQISDRYLKYEHAHSRIMFNYGKILKEIGKSLNEQDSVAEGGGLKHNIEQFFNQNQSSLSEHLFKINDQFNIEKNAELFAKDDLENHALLNQSTTYTSHLELIDILVENEGLKQIQEFLKQTPSIRIAKNTVGQKLINDKSQEELSIFSLWLKDKSNAIKLGLNLQIGIESEFLLRTLKTWPKFDLFEPENENDKIKIALADLNARRKMQIKYHNQSSIPEISDVRKFLETEKPIGPESAKILDIFLIKKDLAESLKKSFGQYKEGEINQVLVEVDRFTKAEIYFYKLLFLEENKLPISIDGVFDPDKTKVENIANIIPLIKKGRFHESLLDMIRAHEVSVGPFDIEQTLPELEKSLSKMNLVANKTGLSFDDANTQINLSFWVDGKNVFMPEISGEGKDKKLYISGLGRGLIKSISTALAEAGAFDGVLRNQQFIEARFDRKKLLPELIDTPYLNINPDKTAFTNHKELAAKTSTLRVSIANKEDEVAVVEIRLIGNNPHFATFGGHEELFKPSINFISQILLPRIADKIKDFIAPKSSEQLKDLLDQKVAISYDGKIAGLDPISVQGHNKINPYNKENSALYEPLKEGLKKAGTKDDSQINYIVGKPMAIKLAENLSREV